MKEILRWHCLARRIMMLKETVIVGVPALLRPNRERREAAAVEM